MPKELLGTAGRLLDYVPFLRGRYGAPARASPWATGFLLEALHTAMADGTGVDISAAQDAAQFAHSLLAGNGPHTWAGMIALWNATMTMEAWDPAAGSGTMSHPWNAAPAVAIPRGLMGLRPSAPGFARAEVAPTPAISLRWASLRYPTHRGTFEVNYTSTANPHTVAVQVRVPGNTQLDHLCAPAYLLAANGSKSLPHVQAKLNDADVSQLVQRGGHLCVTGVGPGVSTLSVRAR